MAWLGDERQWVAPSQPYDRLMNMGWQDAVVFVVVICAAWYVLSRFGLAPNPMSALQRRTPKPDVPTERLLRGKHGRSGRGGSCGH